MADTERTIDFEKLVGALVEDLQKVAGSPRLLRGELPEAEETTLAAELKRMQSGLAEGRSGKQDEVAREYATRKDAALEILTRRHKRLEAYARRERGTVPAQPGRFILAGRVTDEATGIGLPGLEVKAVDEARRLEGLPGSSHTDSLGYFRFEYTEADLERIGASPPEIHVEVLDESGTAVHRSSAAFAPEAGSVAFHVAPVDGATVPESVELGAGIDRTVTRRLGGLERRLRVMGTGADTLSGRVEPEPAPPVEPVTPSPPTRPDREPVDEPVRPERPPTRHSLREIDGVGAVYESRLEASGIADVARVAETDPARLADILETSPARAERIVAEARRLARRGRG